MIPAPPPGPTLRPLAEGEMPALAALHAAAFAALSTAAYPARLVPAYTAMLHAPAYAAEVAESAGRAAYHST